jgi:nucleotide-binding universal stress UspA family protein
MGYEPAEEILKMAEEKSCDLIFMASHGRRGIDKIFLGSQAEKVLKNSKVPVLIFK